MKDKDANRNNPSTAQPRLTSAHAAQDGENACSDSGLRRDCIGSMREEQHRFLSIAGQLPARLTAEQTAWVLGCQLHDMPILIASRLLKPLGNPAQNSIKFFAASEVLELSRERSWLARMTAAINGHWKRQNSKAHALMNSTN